MIFFLQSGLGQVVFPARGFSSILSESQAEDKLEAFRRTVFSSNSSPLFHQGYIYRFQFTHYEKSAQPVIHHGLLSGPSPNSRLLRVDLLAKPGQSEPYVSFLLIRDQNNSRVWKAEKGSIGSKELSQEDWLKPWIKGINHTPFDLLMPFASLPCKYEKSGRVCGRPAHLFIFTSPESNHSFPSHGVRLAIDDAYVAPLRIEHLDGGLLPSRVFSLQSFKKIDERWLVKAIDAKDRDSGSRTRYELVEVAHGLDLNPSIFHSNGLDQPIHLSSITFLAQ